MCPMLFSVGEGWVVLSMHPKEYPPQNKYELIVSLYTLLCAKQFTYIIMQP